MIISSSFAESYNLRLNSKISVQDTLVMGQGFPTWTNFWNESTHDVQEITFNWYLSEDSIVGNDLLLDQWIVNSNQSFLQANSWYCVGSANADMPVNYSPHCDYIIIMEAVLGNDLIESDYTDNYAYKRVCAREQGMDLTAELNLLSQINIFYNHDLEITSIISNRGELSINDSVEYRLLISSSLDFSNNLIEVIGKSSPINNNESISLNDIIDLSGFETNQYYVKLELDYSDQLVEIYEHNNDAIFAFEVVNEECPVLLGQLDLGFEDGNLSGCWSKDNLTGASSPTWSVSQNFPAHGSYSLVFNDSNENTGSEKLISPVFDFSQERDIILSYSYSRVDGYGRDQLFVYYRSDETEEWQILRSYNSENWSTRVYKVDSIRLPNLSDTYQIAFSGYASGGPAIYLDDISIYQGDPLSIAKFGVVFNEAPVKGAIISVDGQTDTVADDGTVSFQLEKGRYKYVVFADSLETYADSIVVDGLTEFNNVAMQPINCTINQFPWKYGFESYGKLSECWQIEQIAGATIQNWRINDYNERSGDYCMYYNGLHNDVEKLISPVFDFTDAPRMSLRFYLKLSTETYSDLRVYYRLSETSDWTILAKYEDNIDNYTLQQLSLPNLSSTYQIAFEGWGENCNSIYIEDLEIIETNAVGKIKVTVLNEDTSEPIARAKMLINGQECSTQADGIFRIDLPIGDYKYELYAPEMEPLYGTLQVNTSSSTTFNLYVNERICTVSEFPSVYGWDESGILWKCWQNESVSGNSLATWSLVEGENINDFDISLKDSVTNGDTVKFISPTYDLSNFTDVNISFLHMQPASESGQDELKVYYRTSESDNWVLMAEYSSDIPAFQLDTLNVPELTASMQFAFEGSCMGGNGIFVDDFSVFEVWPNVYFTVTEYGKPKAFAELLVDDILYTTDANGKIRLPFNDGKYFYMVSSSEDKGSGWFIVDEPVEYVSVETEPNICAVSEFPWRYGVENKELFVKCFTNSSKEGGPEWIITDEDKSEGDFGLKLGSARVLNSTVDLITPIFNVDSESKMNLAFSYKNSGSYYDQNYLGVYYRLSESHNWRLLKSYDNALSIFYRDTIVLPQLSSTMQIAFRGQYSSANGLYIDDIEIFEDPKTTVQVSVQKYGRALSGVKVLIGHDEYQTNSDGIFNIGIYGGEYLYRVTDKDNSEYFGKFEVSGVNDTVVINIKPTCAISKFPWSYGFENSTNFDKCWTSKCEAGECYGWQISWPSHTGTKAAHYNYAEEGTVCKLISPVLNFSDYYNAQLSFYHMQEAYSGSDELRVYYRISRADDWVLLDEFTPPIDDYTQHEIDLSNLSSTYQLAFEITSGNGMGIFIDDITITAKSTLSKKKIEFNVSNGIDPIEGASITFGDTEMETFFDGSNYSYAHNGIYEYTVTAEGMLPQKGLFELSGSILEIDVVLDPIPVFYEVQFSVLNDGVAVEEANIIIGGNEFVTNSTGVATIDLEAGNYPYVVSASGYGDIQGMLNVSDGAYSEVISIEKLPAVESLLDVEACGAYYFAGKSLSQSGTYSQTYTAFNGADSIVTLNLTIKEVFDLAIEDTIREGQIYLFGSQTLDTTGTYIEIFQTADGCDSAVTLDLTVLDGYRTDISHIACVSYNFYGEEITQSGTYYKKFEAVDGSDSTIVLDLTINGPYEVNIYDTIFEGDQYRLGIQLITSAGDYTEKFTSVYGCDSLVNLFLTVQLKPVLETLTEYSCGSYLWNGKTYTKTGIYTETFTAQNGADSVVTLDLTIYPEYALTFKEIINEGETYSFGAKVFDKTGIYTETFQTINGCDSIVTLELRVSNGYLTELQKTVCGSYNFYGQELTESGKYIEVLEANDGDDSTIVLNLTVNTAYEYNVTATIDDGEQYDFGDQLLSKTGIYTETFQTINGCDSIVTLELRVSNGYLTGFQKTVCGSYNFYGQELTESGKYIEVLEANDGDDSTIVLNLTVNTTYEYNVTDTIDDGEQYHFGDLLLTEEGNYTQQFSSVFGCDSIVHLTLKVNHRPIIVNLTESACGSYIWNRKVYTESGLYFKTYKAQNGADSIVNLDLTVFHPYEDSVEVNIPNGENYMFGDQILTRPGTYTETFISMNGCDSTVELHLSIIDVEFRITTTETQYFIPENIDGYFELTTIEVFNPSGKQLTYSLTGGDGLFDINQDGTIYVKEDAASMINNNENYALIVSVSISEIGSSTLEIDVAAPVAPTTAYECDNNVIVYPKVVESILYVDCKNRSGKVSIYSLGGINLLEAPISRRSSFDLSGFGSGVYIVKVALEGSVYFNKITVIH